MARVTYEKGVKCLKCGNLITTVNRFNRTILCQECGAYIGDFDLSKKELLITDNAKDVVIKVTHKLFSNIYEEV